MIQDCVAQLDQNVGICIKNSSLKVLSKNSKIQRICKTAVGSHCRESCVQAFRCNPLDIKGGEGVHMLSSVNISGNFCDVVMLNTGNKIITMLYPLKNKHNRLLSKLKAKGLSQRECEIMKLVMDKLTNEQIAQRLFISRSTVRTHLNNIYKKLPPDWQKRG